MNEDQLRALLSSISHLAEHGDIPVHAFGTLISSARGELIAEHLHQRWLSDPNFAKIAADIVLQLHGASLINTFIKMIFYFVCNVTHKKIIVFTFGQVSVRLKQKCILQVENRNMTVCSQVLSLALKDFKSRRKIRKNSRHMFRNYMRTLIALYPVYRKIDKYLSACLIEPLFRSLQTLVDDRPDDNDLRCVANIVISSGQTLNQLNATELDNAVMKCRRWLISTNIQLEEETKFLMLHAIDLWTYSWDLQLFPDCLRQFYEEQKDQRKREEILKERIEIAVTSSKRKVSAPIEKLRRQNTIIHEYPTLNDLSDEGQLNRKKLSMVSFMSDVGGMKELEEVMDVNEKKVINDIDGHFAFEKEESAV